MKLGSKGGVAQTLNGFDNTSDIRATVLTINETGGGNVPAIFPIDDARELEKHQNGLGIGEQGAPAYTLDRQQIPGVVAFSPSGFADYSEGVGTLKAGMTNNNSPLVAFDVYNFTTNENTNQTIRAAANADHIGAVMNEVMVRRLTPTECERLQGFPDGWTSQRYDFKKNVVVDQADSSRYKQMGNAVAVPVVEWIISRLIAEIA